ncbi:MAG TPA: Spy/CpxP family protein refolding chaperone [Noviherbaspirillum sp.]|nr:Spy/CpxP family protein refolding chaperone [Noviherbaspirillum sp.]
MTPRKTLACRLLAFSLLSAPFLVSAQPMPPGPPHGMPAPGGSERLPPYLHSIHLDETQRDKIFTLMHAQAPQLRELEKTRMKAQQELAELAMSGQFSESKAKKAADTLARATADIALTRARVDSQIVALLTPEQRSRLEQQRKAAEHGRPEAPGSGPR